MSQDWKTNRFDPQLETLLSPAAAFDHPDDVVADPDLTLAEKRAILSSWASDACAVEAMPCLRQPHGARPAIPLDDIFDALRELDRFGIPDGRYRRLVRRKEFDDWRSGSDGGSLIA